MQLDIIFAAVSLAVLLPGVAGAVEIRVLSTQAPEQAYRELAPQFEKASGHTVTTVFTGTLDVQKRIAAGEAYDLIIMAGPAIDDFIKSGKIVPGSRVNIARSGVGVAVRAGAPKPDIGTTEAVKKTLLTAKSIGYSTGPSGVYLTGRSNTWASPIRSRASSSRPRPAFSSATSWPTARPRSASSR
jgi:molybdate transport system substrate-binding protein